VGCSRHYNKVLINAYPRKRGLYDHAVGYFYTNEEQPVDFFQRSASDFLLSEWFLQANVAVFSLGVL
jgi:hypothetical protein